MASWNCVQAMGQESDTKISSFPLGSQMTQVCIDRWVCKFVLWNYLQGSTVLLSNNNHLKLRSLQGTVKVKRPFIFFASLLPWGAFYRQTFLLKNASRSLLACFEQGLKDFLNYCCCLNSAELASFGCVLLCQGSGLVVS